MSKTVFLLALASLVSFSANAFDPQNPSGLYRCDDTISAGQDKVITALSPALNKFYEVEIKEIGTGINKYLEVEVTTIWPNHKNVSDYVSRGWSSGWGDDGPEWQLEPAPNKVGTSAFIYSRGDTKEFKLFFPSSGYYTICK